MADSILFLFVDGASLVTLAIFKIIYPLKLMYSKVAIQDTDQGKLIFFLSKSTVGNSFVVVVLVYVSNTHIILAWIMLFMKRMKRHAGCWTNKKRQKELVLILFQLF